MNSAESLVMRTDRTRPAEPVTEVLFATVVLRKDTLLAPDRYPAVAFPPVLLRNSAFCIIRFEGEL